MIVSSLRRYNHLMNTAPVSVVTSYKTPFLHQYTSGVAINIYTIFILTKMLLILNVFSLK